MPETSIEAESCISGEPELDSIENIEFVVDDVNDAKYNNKKDAIIAFFVLTDKISLLWANFEDECEALTSVVS